LQVKIGFTFAFCIENCVCFRWG